MAMSFRIGKIPRRIVVDAQRRLLSQTQANRQSSTNRVGGSDNGGQREIRISGLPRTANPADVVRLARQSIRDDGLAKSIAGAQVDYNRFISSGRAIVTMSSGFFVDKACKALRDTQMSSLPLKARIVPQQQDQRSRGSRGLKEASERGTFDGCGLGGGIKPKGNDVVLYGLPGRIAAPALRLFLRRIGVVKTAANGEPDCEVLTVEPPRREGFTATSKHLIRLKTAAQAHAFVRKMHLTYFLPEVWSQRYLLRARVVY